MWLLLWLMIVKRLLWLLLVGFFFFFWTSLPAEAGNAVEETGQVLGSVFTWLASVVGDVIPDIEVQLR